MKKNKIVVQGWDLALNHSGYVELTNGELSNFWYITSLVGSANKSKHGFRLVLPKTNDKQLKSMVRLDFIENFIAEKLIARKPDYVGIEDYALGIDHGSHYMGEVGGIARMLCWKAGIPFRLHDPLSVCL
jgi:hypothetical protein